MNARAEHRAAIQNSLRSTRELKTLFNALGSAERPNGKIMRAYRTARAALQNEARGERRAAFIMQTLADLSGQVRDALDAEFANAFRLGEAQAERELTIYGLSPAVSAPRRTMREHVNLVMADVYRQVSIIETRMLMDALDESIVGDEEHVGILAPGAVLKSATRALVDITGAAYADLAHSAARKKGKDAFKRQAIAALDERTTQTCLLVHAQVVGLDEDFILRGTPRYADRMRNPGFHWYCRTCTCLVRVERADDDLSVEMRRAAADELKARQDGSRQVILPANATSRRN